MSETQNLNENNPEWFDIPNSCNYQINKLGQVYSKNSNTILKQTINGVGYLKCQITFYTDITDLSTYKVKTEYIHRLLAKMFIPNDDPVNKKYIDHLNRNKLDNRLENLRWVSAEENAINCGLSKRNTSGFRGVHFDKIRGKYVAQLGKKKLGYTDTKEEAHQLYKQAYILKYPHLSHNYP